MISAYMTYIVCEVNETPELIPLDSQCHRMPSKEILQTDSVRNYFVTKEGDICFYAFQLLLSEPVHD